MLTLELSGECEILFAHGRSPLDATTYPGNHQQQVKYMTKMNVRKVSKKNTARHICLRFLSDQSCNLGFQTFFFQNASTEIYVKNVLLFFSCRNISFQFWNVPVLGPDMSIFFFPEGQCNE